MIWLYEDLKDKDLKELEEIEESCLKKINLLYPDLFLALPYLRHLYKVMERKRELIRKSP